MKEQDLFSDYIHLAFMLDRHFPGYVDAYCGPAQLKTQALRHDVLSLDILADTAFSLEQAVSQEPALLSSRRSFLLEELRAMRTTIRILRGDQLDFMDEVRLLYGVTPAWVDETTFADAHKKLNEILPGSGALSERILAYRQRSRVPPETGLSVIRQLADTLRSRVQRLYGLPQEEGCEFTLVTDKPWQAYNWFLGSGRSKVEFNQDHPMEMWSMLSTTAHETYPGHHTEFSLKESGLYRRQGFLEHAIFLSNNPSSLISEGIAKNALNAVCTKAEQEELILSCYARAGLPQSDAQRALAFAEANQQLERVSDNQLLMLYRDHASQEEVIDYGMRYALSAREDEIHYLRFYQDPLSRSYAYNYTLGRELIASYLDRAADKVRAFQRLLSEPCTPTQLLNEISAADQNLE